MKKFIIIAATATLAASAFGQITSYPITPSQDPASYPTFNQNTTGTAAGVTGKTFSGPGTVLPTCTGSLTSGNLISSDASHNCVDSGVSATNGVGNGLVVYTSPAATVFAAGNNFVPYFGTDDRSSTESNKQLAAASAGTVSNLVVTLLNGVAVPGGDSLVITWRKNTSSQTLTCTIVASASTCSDLTHTFAVAQGDLIDINVAATGGATVGVISIQTQYGTGGATNITFQQTGTGSVLTTQGAQIGLSVNPQQFGAMGDVRTVTDAVLTATQHTVTSTQAAFTSADVLKWVSCVGAGPTPTAGIIVNQGLTGQITGVAGNVATMSGVTVSNTVSGGTCKIGTDDTTAWQNMLNLANANGEVQVTCPTAEYFVGPLLYYSKTTINAPLGCKVDMLIKVPPSAGSGATVNWSRFKPANFASANTDSFQVNGGTWDMNWDGSDYSYWLNNNSDGANHFFFGQNSSNVTVQNAVIQNMYTDTFYAGPQNLSCVSNPGTESNNLWFLNNTVNKVGRNFSSNAGGTNVHIQGNIISGVIYRNPGDFVDYEPFNSCKDENYFISDNHVTSSQGGIEVSTGTSAIPTNIRSHDNVIDGLTSSYSLLVNGGTHISSINDRFVYPSTPAGAITPINLPAGDDITVMRDSVTGGRASYTIAVTAATNVNLVNDTVSLAYTGCLNLAGGSGIVTNFFCDRPGQTTSSNAMADSGGTSWNRIGISVSGGTYTNAVQLGANNWSCTSCSLPAGTNSTIFKNGFTIATPSVIAGSGASVSADATTGAPTVSVSGGQTYLLRTGANIVTTGVVTETVVTSASNPAGSLTIGKDLFYTFAGTCAGVVGTHTIKVRFGNTTLTGTVLGTITPTAQNWLLQGQISATANLTAQDAEYKTSVGNGGVTAFPHTVLASNNTSTATLLELTMALTGADTCTVTTYNAYTQ